MILPEDLPKAILVLIWLLSGTIMFGALLMKTSVLGSVVFALLFFGLPVAFVQMKKKRGD